MVQPLLLLVALQGLLEPQRQLEKQVLQELVPQLQPQQQVIRVKVILLLVLALRVLQLQQLLVMSRRFNLASQVRHQN